MQKNIFYIVLSSFLLLSSVAAQNTQRTLSGVVVDPQFQFVPNITVEAVASGGELRAVTDGEGNFSLQVPTEPLSVTFSGKGVNPVTRDFTLGEQISDLQIKISFVVAPINESVTIEDNTLAPAVDFRNENIYDKTLFSRDDQVFQTLNAGINAGQHEGGGKSLEIRRFGFNLDHGGVNGGLKVLVDNVQQNQSTQGHGQGYLGSLKFLSPELVEGVSIVNGPFSAQYGDFSGLGVVHIKLREELPNLLTLRLQGGNFDTFRMFLAYSPKIKNVRSFISYEGSRSDGPFVKPLNYNRDNVTGNFTFRRGETESFGFKFNAARNTSDSSGQIPLNEVFAGRLDRFGFIPGAGGDGGKSYAYTGNFYYSKELGSGGVFKADAFVSRSLFDIFSNFTFFLLDPVYGDEIQQHDSRLQEGANAQYLRPFKLFGNQSLLTIGGNLHLNQINVGLYPTIERNPIRKFLPENIDFRDDNGDGVDDVLLTSDRASINNYAAYVQNGTDFFNGHLRVDVGLRIDTFTFDVRDQINPQLSQRTSSTKLQPKLAVAWSPFEKIPTSFYFNYGRGISSQDARGIVRNSEAPKVATTDFYQAGSSANFKRVSLAGDFFLIDRSNEQVYVADDGTLEFKGPSRTYGVEGKVSWRLTRFLSFNGGFTQVFDSFYRGTSPREYIDSAPHFVATGI